MSPKPSQLDTFTQAQRHTIRLVLAEHPNGAPYTVWERQRGLGKATIARIALLGWVTAAPEQNPPRSHAATSQNRASHRARYLETRIALLRIQLAAAENEYYSLVSQSVSQVASDILQTPTQRRR